MYIDGDITGKEIGVVHNLVSFNFCDGKYSLDSLLNEVESFKQHLAEVIEKELADIHKRVSEFLYCCEAHFIDTIVEHRYEFFEVRRMLRDDARREMEAVGCNPEWLKSKEWQELWIGHKMPPNINYHVDYSKLKAYEKTLASVEAFEKNIKSNRSYSWNTIVELT